MNQFETLGARGRSRRRARACRVLPRQGACHRLRTRDRPPGRSGDGLGTRTRRLRENPRLRFEDRRGLAWFALPAPPARAAADTTTGPGLAGPPRKPTRLTSTLRGAAGAPPTPPLAGGRRRGPLARASANIQCRCASANASHSKINSGSPSPATSHTLARPPLSTTPRAASIAAKRSPKTTRCVGFGPWSWVHTSNLVMLTPRRGRRRPPPFRSGVPGATGA